MTKDKSREFRDKNQIGSYENLQTEKSNVQDVDNKIGTVNYERGKTKIIGDADVIRLEIKSFRLVQLVRLGIGTVVFFAARSLILKKVGGTEIIHEFLKMIFKG